MDRLALTHLFLSSSCTYLKQYPSSDNCTPGAGSGAGRHCKVVMAMAGSKSLCAFPSQVLLHHTDQFSPTMGVICFIPKLQRVKVRVGAKVSIWISSIVSNFMHPCCKSNFVYIYTLWVGPLLCIYLNFHTHRWLKVRPRRWQRISGNAYWFRGLWSLYW